MSTPRKRFSMYLHRFHSSPQPQFLPLCCLPISLYWSTLITSYPHILPTYCVFQSSAEYTQTYPPPVATKEPSPPRYPAHLSNISLDIFRSRPALGKISISRSHLHPKNKPICLTSISLLLQCLTVSIMLLLPNIQSDLLQWKLSALQHPSPSTYLLALPHYSPLMPTISAQALSSSIH